MNQMPFKQDGGTIQNNEQKEFTAFLITVLKPKDQKDFEDKVSQLTDTDLKQLYTEYKNMKLNKNEIKPRFKNGGTMENTKLVPNKKKEIKKRFMKK